MTRGTCECRGNAAQWHAGLVVMCRADRTCHAVSEASVPLRAEKRQMLRRKLRKDWSPVGSMTSGEVPVKIACILSVEDGGTGTSDEQEYPLVVVYRRAIKLPKDIIGTSVLAMLIVCVKNTELAVFA